MFFAVVIVLGLKRCGVDEPADEGARPLQGCALDRESISNCHYIRRCAQHRLSPPLEIAARSKEQALGDPREELDQRNARIRVVETRPAWLGSLDDRLDGRDQSPYRLEVDGRR